VEIEQADNSEGPIATPARSRRVPPEPIEPPATPVPPSPLARQHLSPQAPLLSTPRPCRRFAHPAQHLMHSLLDTTFYVPGFRCRRPAPTLSHPAWADPVQVYLAGRGRGGQRNAVATPSSKAQAGSQKRPRGGAAACSRLRRTPRDEHQETNNQRRTKPGQRSGAPSARTPPTRRRRAPQERRRRDPARRAGRRD
jgi:hypothetical protein